MSRVAIHSDFDAVVDFFPLEQIPELVYGIVKFTYSLADGRVRRVEPVPLFHDIRDPNIEPKWSPGSDFWPLKTHTDVAVRGQAYAHATKTSARTIGIRVGEHRKNIAVWGDRVARWHGGRLRFEPPEPFESIPVVWSRAYGGCDPRVPVDAEPTTVATLARLEFDHPGMYPRNPFGCGYVVLPDPVPEIVLPNFEDPAHLLTPETLITAHPGRWYEQPLPACFEFTNAMMFHRLAWMGLQPWFPPPAGAPLAEVEAGVLPENYRDLARVSMEHPPPAPVFQEGAHGLVFPPLLPGTPVTLEGMHRERKRLTFLLPEPPKVEFWIEGQVFAAPAEPSTLLIEPDEERFSVTYVARHEELPRVFVPGIHADIPLALRVDGVTVRYLSPPTLYAQLGKAPPP